MVISKDIHFIKLSIGMGALGSMERVIKLRNLDKELIDDILESVRKNNVLTLFYDDNHELGPHLMARYLWKSIGLILCDGNLSALIGGYKTITFRGVTKETSIAVIMTFLPLRAYLRVRIYPQGGEKRRYFGISVLSKGAFRKQRDSLLQLLHALVSQQFDLRNLDSTYISALLAGLIDGDGYVGKEGKYLAVSVAKGESVKGRTIYSILVHAEQRGYIVLGTYRGKPSYEVSFRFLKMDFARNCLELVFHPLRRARLQRYLLNWAKNYECGFTVEELQRLITAASSAYIQQRKEPRRSKVLVLYLQREAFDKVRTLWFGGQSELKPRPIVSHNRVMVKIAEKCRDSLREAIDILARSHNLKKVKVTVIDKIMKFIYD